MSQLDEHEQGERVRTWLKNNGSSLLMGVALGLAALWGWQWWQGQQANRQALAGGEFLAFGKALDAGEIDKAEAFASSLRQNHGGGPYPALVALALAEHKLAEGQGEQALAELDSVSREGLEAELADLVQLRAARVLLTLGRHEEAIDRLAGLEAGGRYVAAAAELRGDAERALGRREQAREAYARALANLDEAAAIRPLLEMKLADAGGQPSGQPET
ncbi:YfgM family protein [Arenimonas fontis]|uniref:Ancillary SecYEG translocon subunit n=1 Tax=Arenimonas fontis TaxID=2608255 RepID=A0A5B2ZEB7_9GAMM|nr:tetratricopeptide repeat protein [Arenimonas fontis]KAA2285973.1 tetratricopeptide repeat protein [Arenimonas fontis]